MYVVIVWTGIRRRSSALGGHASQERAMAGGVGRMRRPGNFRGGHPRQGVHLMSDNGCQPTSTRFMEACGGWTWSRRSLSYNNPKGNADTERMMRTLKGTLVAERMAQPERAEGKLSAWILSSMALICIPRWATARQPGRAGLLQQNRPNSLLNAA
jgi:hypothetical protein